MSRSKLDWDKAAKADKVLRQGFERIEPEPSADGMRKFSPGVSAKAIALAGQKKARKKTSAVATSNSDSARS